MEKSLVYKFLNTSSLNADVCQTEWRNGIYSSWSKRINVALDDASVVRDKLYETFHPLVDRALWDERFIMAIGGSGDEKKKITTLHSSSLLALLFFSGITAENPLLIDRIPYNQVFFEIKNKVFPNAAVSDKPSNIDIMLVSETSEDLLFIESKFTEYFDCGKINISEKYLNFYDRLFALIPDSRLKLEGSAIKCKGSESSQYIAGIKQMFSHIIGLATGPDASVSDEVRNYIEKAKRIRVIEVAHKWDRRGVFDNYAGLYSDIFRHIDNSVLSKCLEGEGCDPGKIKRISVGKEIYTYQQILDQNPSFRLSETVKEFYRLT